MDDFTGAFVVAKDAPPPQRKALPFKKIFSVFVLLIVVASTGYFAFQKFGNRNSIGNEPFKTKFVNKTKGTGEFVLGESTQKADLIREKQAVVEGNYNPASPSTPNVKVFFEESEIPTASSFIQPREQEVVLTVEVVVNGVAEFRINTKPSTDVNNNLTFGARLPYHQNFLLNIYDNASKLIYSKQHNL